MADFPCIFIEPPEILFLPAQDPTDYAAVIMPYTLVLDDVPPFVANVSPALLSDLDKGSVVQFDVSDVIDIATVCIFAWFEKTRTYEVVWDGDDFGPDYEDFSERTDLLVGWHFLIARKGGWPSPPKLRIHAVDKAGNISV